MGSPTEHRTTVWPTYTDLSKHDDHGSDPHTHGAPTRASNTRALEHALNLIAKSLMCTQPEPPCLAPVSVLHALGGSLSRHGEGHGFQVTFWMAMAAFFCSSGSSHAASGCSSLRERCSCLRPLGSSARFASSLVAF